MKTLNKSSDILKLKIGEVISKSNYKFLNTRSRIQSSPYYEGPEYEINNSYQKGINWVGPFYNPTAVIIKSNGRNYPDSHTDYSFEARNGIVNKNTQANQVLINQPEYDYPIYYFEEYLKSYLKLIGIFAVSEIHDTYVDLIPYSIGKQQANIKQKLSPSVPNLQKNGNQNKIHRVISTYDYNDPYIDNTEDQSVLVRNQRNLWINEGVRQKQQIEKEQYINKLKSEFEFNDFHLEPTKNNSSFERETLSHKEINESDEECYDVNSKFTHNKHPDPLEIIKASRTVSSEKGCCSFKKENGESLHLPEEEMINSTRPMANVFVEICIYKSDRDTTCWEWSSLT